MKRLLILAAMALGLTTAAMPDSAEAGRWRGGYSYGGYYPGHYHGGYYYGGYQPYRSYYRSYYRPYRSYYYGGWGPRGYVSTPWAGVYW
jgi:hypothetical protein